MIGSRIAWAAWALVPVAAAAYHYGPGQAQYTIDRTASLQDIAARAQDDAQAAQEIAYAKHLDALAARRAAFLDETDASEAMALALTKEEDALYATAAAKWKDAADRCSDVLMAMGGASDDASRDVRWAKAHATVRSGDMWAGIEELEAMIDELDALRNDASATPRTARQTTHDTALTLAAREELATAYYYGARLLRLSGMPPQEWRVESGKARQHFRYLAENEPSDDAENHQRNLELVLNLEQSSLVELQGTALPRQSPGNGQCKQGNRPGKKPGKRGQRPGKDGRGAGGVEAIRDGW
ncbi:MAG: hypothetical protein EXS03_09560 [Phycisphaerales bacterium]|nr:hypothetical protein [Phycisphaerales bacterium]